MMISTTKIVLSFSMLLAILFALQVKDGESVDNFFDKPTVTVFIDNNISDFQLGVNCEDSHNKIGFRSLKFGEIYQFSLKPNFAETTLYHCRFIWGTVFHHFDIYIEHRDKDDCKHECHWKINKSGPCKEKTDSEECFPWNPEVGEENNALNA